MDLEANEACEAMTFRPTLRQRLARALGYRYQLTDLPTEADGLPGWWMTSIQIRLGWRDRLRLLLSGRMDLDVRNASVEPSPETIYSATSVRIIAPWEPGA